MCCTMQVCLRGGQVGAGRGSAHIVSSVQPDVSIDTLSTIILLPSLTAWAIDGFQLALRS